MGPPRCGHQVDRAAQQRQWPEGAAGVLDRIETKVVKPEAWDMAIHPRRLAGGGRWVQPFQLQQGARDTPLGLNANELVRAIRTGQLHVLPRLHIRPIDVVVDHGSRRDLVLRRVSRLDAFSGYPCRT